jgi:flagellar biosynthesis/type III secretory pathway protein FliH
MDGFAPAFLRDPPMSFGRPPLGILYVEDFDAPEPPVAAAVADIVTPELTEADLEQARADGYEAGHREARLEQDAVRADLRAAALAAIGDALAASRGEAARVAHGMEEELAATLLAMLAGAMPAACAALAGSEVSATVTNVLAGLRREPVVRVMVHPDVMDDVTAAIHTILPEQAARVVLCADAALEPADAHVTWTDGAARRDITAHWTALRETLRCYQLPELQDIVAGLGANTKRRLGANMNAGLGENMNAGLGENMNAGLGANTNAGLGAKNNAGYRANRNADLCTESSYHGR